MRFILSFELDTVRLPIEIRRTVISFFKKSLTEAHNSKYYPDFFTRTQIKDYSFSVVFPLDKYFREEIYSDWIQNCENKNITLKIVQSHNNQDVFRAICEKDILIFRVWYGTSEQSRTKGFFSKIEVLEKSSEIIFYPRYPHSGSCKGLFRMWIFIFMVGADFTCFLQ